MPSRPVLDLCHCKGESSSSNNELSAMDSSEEISSSQQECLCAFRECLEEKGLLQKYTSDADLLRFLRARCFDIVKARLMYESMIEWRKEISADTIIEVFFRFSSVIPAII